MAAKKPSVMAEIRRKVELLKSAAEPNRFLILSLLTEKERNVSELCAKMGHQTQPAVSHHLALLRHGHLVEFRRSGKTNVYSLTDAGRELAMFVNTKIA